MRSLHFVFQNADPLLCQDSASSENIIYNVVIHHAYLCASEASTKLRHTHCQCQHTLVLTFLLGEL